MQRHSVCARYLRYVKEEISAGAGHLIQRIGACRRMMAKLEARRAARRTWSASCLPAGYSFNLDGTSIYLAMAVVFLAQATNTPLSFGQEMGLLGLLLLTSKGAAAVTGGGFITLAATLSSTHNTSLMAGLAILIGIDRFMSEGARHHQPHRQRPRYADYRQERGRTRHGTGRANSPARRGAGRARSCLTP